MTSTFSDPYSAPKALRGEADGGKEKTMINELATRIHRHIRIHDEMVRALREECHHEDCISAAGMVLCQRCGSSWGEDDPAAPESTEVEVGTMVMAEARAPDLFHLRGMTAKS